MFYHLYLLKHITVDVTTFSINSNTNVSSPLPMEIPMDLPMVLPAELPMVLPTALPMILPTDFPWHYPRIYPSYLVLCLMHVI